MARRYPFCRLIALSCLAAVPLVSIQLAEEAYSLDVPLGGVEENEYIEGEEGGEGEGEDDLLEGRETEEDSIGRLGAEADAKLEEAKALLDEGTRELENEHKELPANPPSPANTLSPPPAHGTLQTTAAAGEQPSHSADSVQTQKRRPSFKEKYEDYVRRVKDAVSDGFSAIKNKFRRSSSSD